ncbi:MAG: hypothetical protein LBL21_02360 [Rickettsiales bacterium]|jgi:hypothetical protein|nr:hypothetical protein [Rickettsiales bacterium]
MKKLLAFVLMAGFAGVAFASCPTAGGWVEKTSAEYEAVGDNECCPPGYIEVVDPDIMPYSECDGGKGTCATVCEVPLDCNPLASEVTTCS